MALTKHCQLSTTIAKHTHTHTHTLAHRYMNLKFQSFRAECMRISNAHLLHVTSERNNLRLFARQTVLRRFPTQYFS